MDIFLIIQMFLLISFGHAKLLVKVAHLQPNNPNIIHEPQVLEMFG